MSLEKLIRKLKKDPRKWEDIENVLLKFPVMNDLTKKNYLECMVKYYNADYLDMLFDQFDATNTKDIDYLANILKKHKPLVDAYGDEDIIHHIGYIQGKSPKIQKELFNVLKKYSKHPKGEEVINRLVYDEISLKELKVWNSKYTRDILANADEKKQNLVYWISFISDTLKPIKRYSEIEDKEIVKALTEISEEINKETYFLDYMELIQKHREAPEVFHELIKDPFTMKNKAIEPAIEIYNEFGFSIMKQYIECVAKTDEHYRMKTIKGVKRKLRGIKRLIKSYKRKGIDLNVAEEASRLEKGYFNKVVKAIDNKRINKIINSIDDKQLFMDIIIRASPYNHSTYADFFEKNSQHQNIGQAAKTIYSIMSEELVSDNELFTELIKKYLDYPGVLKKITEKKPSSDQMSDLLEDDTYDILKTDSDAYGFVMGRANMHWIKHIHERKVIPIEDLQKAVNLHEFIMKIHEDRNGTDRHIIAMNYFRELNRAIAQGHDEESKIRNLQIYCAEVYKAMKENAAELMLQNA